MARCRLSDRKVRRKVRPLVPDHYDVAGAMVRGGNPHNLVLACLFDCKTGERRGAEVDTSDGTCSVLAHGWRFSDESSLRETLLKINDREVAYPIC